MLIVRLCLEYQLMFDNFLQQDQYHSSDAVFNRIFLGDVQSALDLDFLNNNQILTVVTAAKDMDHIRYDQHILHIVYPLLDAKNQQIAPFFDNFFNLVETNISKGSILVHCAAGISRSSTLVISYLMKFKRVPFKQAIAEVRRYRPSVLPNLGFERQLKKYEELLKCNVTEERTPRRGESKTAQSSGQQLMTKTQLVPNFGNLLVKKEKLVSRNIINLTQKINERQMQVKRIYNNQQRNNSKHKKFVITKKAASFSRQPENKALVVTAFREHEPKEHGPKYNKHLTSIQKMKAIYLVRKGIAERRNTNVTDRSGTFYNVYAIQ